MDKRISLRIDKIVEETSSVKTFCFSSPIDALPGQFIMLSDLRTGEKPFSISSSDSNGFSVTVKALGPFSSGMFAFKTGDFLSIRGPFGKPFDLRKGSILIAGGGVGVPPLFFLARELKKAGTEVVFINGAKNSDELIFKDLINELGINQIIMTDDGSSGKKGNAAEGLLNTLNESDFDAVYVAGPEGMLKKIADIKTDTYMELLIERYMKCAVGICGQCAVDPSGIRVCVEGPVFNQNMIRKLTEFGVYKRDAAGRKKYFEKAFSK
ncbi:dihydroorotate dehydrogenase electron transfer subunit [bacterium]|nr:dihydroorotate dehydrogenase electron transfer subunit [bacterium]